MKKIIIAILSMLLLFIIVCAVSCRMDAKFAIYGTWKNRNGKDSIEFSPQMKCVLRKGAYGREGV